jgi:hypothetical protein
MPEMRLQAIVGGAGDSAIADRPKIGARAPMGCSGPRREAGFPRRGRRAI